MTLLLAAVGIITEIYFADRFTHSFDSIAIYVLVCILLFGDSDVNSIVDKVSGQERHNKKRWKIAFWLGKHMDVLAFIMVIAQLSLTWFDLRP